MIITKKPDFENHPITPDPIKAVIVDVTDPILKETKWGPKERMSVVFETEMKMDNGKPWIYMAHGYTPSLFDKSNLRKDIIKITGADPGESFDTETLIGKAVKIIIDHSVDGDKTYANHTYLKMDDSQTPLRPSGGYVRKKDREAKKESDGSYQKIEPTQAQTEEPWPNVKVHVGQYAGHVVSDLPSEAAVDALLGHWWPTVEAKPSADDRRLGAALKEAKAFFEKNQTPAPVKAF